MYLYQTNVFFPSINPKIRRNVIRLQSMYVFLTSLEYQIGLSKNLWIYGLNTQIVKYIVGGTLKTLIALLIPNIFFMTLFFYVYKSWGHDSIWYFSCFCRKVSELRALLFLSSTQTSQNLKFIKKCQCLSSLKTKF